MVYKCAGGGGTADTFDAVYKKEEHLVLCDYFDCDWCLWHLDGTEWYHAFAEELVGIPARIDRGDVSGVWRIVLEI